MKNIPVVKKSVMRLLRKPHLQRFNCLYYSTSLLKTEEQQMLQLADNKITAFCQEQPKLENQYTGDVTLQRYLKHVLPKDVLGDIEPDLQRFGKRVTQDIHELGLECERSPPIVEHFDAWGNRVDRIITCESWKKMKDISAEEGVISIAYERKYGKWSRLYQMAKIYLFTTSSGIFGCPLAMTDGAAKTLETLNIKHLDFAYHNLISRDPKKFWTSGQWMTEKRGGSDVGNGTETLAFPQKDGTFYLYGYKWFSSATDSDMALTLARIVDQNNEFVQGSRGLTMFYLNVKDDNGKLNNLEVVKLKNKLGTRQLPTAELILNGTVAQKVSEEGKGVSAISNMLNITRIHNALFSVGNMRRILSLARDYSKRRKTFGKFLYQHPLHMQTLARMELEVRGAVLFVLETTRLLGLHDCSEASRNNVQLLRLLTPLIKLYTAKRSVEIVSEGIEAFGGQGYIEDTGLPRLLRDVQITPIWEGTTNILSLDLLRVFANHPDVFDVYESDIIKRLEFCNGIEELQQPIACIKNCLKHMKMFLQKHEIISLELAARDLAFTLSRVYIGALLIEHAAWEDSKKEDILCAQRWCHLDLMPIVSGMQAGLYEKSIHKQNENLVFEGYTDLF